MKALRMAFVCFTYILGAPILVLGVIALFIVDLYTSIRYNGLHGIGDFETAAFEGLRVGHRINMLWVKYGKNMSDYIVDEAEVV